MFEHKLIAHQMKILNQGKQYPLDYIKKLHPDYMTSFEASELIDVKERQSQFKMMVMRKVTETRNEKSRPRLAMLLNNMKGL